MMDGPRYRKVLDDKLKLFMNLHGTSHFLKDSAPCHKSKMVTKWFEERPHITLIKWPGNSPDLNPIENVWKGMKDQLKQFTTVTNIEDWKREITQLWVTKMSDSQYLRNLVESMPSRLQEVIDR